MNHLYANSSSDEKLKKDILDGKKYFEKWVKEPLLFRPPGGYINDAVFKTAKEAGIKLYYGHGTKTHVIGQIQVLNPL